MIQFFMYTVLPLQGGFIVNVNDVLQHLRCLALSIRDEAGSLKCGSRMNPSIDMAHGAEGT